MSTNYKTAQYESLKDKVVFLSGGASGIGAAFVEAFIQQERAFSLTEFESYLVSLYFEQLIKGADKNE